MDVARVWREAEHAGIDIAAMIAEAIRAKQAEEAAKYAKIEQPPAGKELTWHTTPEEIARINAGDRKAVDDFYFNNLKRLTCSAYRYMRNNPYVKAIVSYEDLLNQVYVELRTGVIKLRPFDAGISQAVFHSFRYAAVGGFDEIYIYRAKEKTECQKAAN